MADAFALYGTGMNYSHFGGSHADYGRFGGEMPYYRRYANMTPEEREAENLKRNKARLEHQSAMKKLAAEQNIKEAEYARELEAQRTREITSAALAAKNVQTILRTGKIDLFGDAWANYLKELAKIPEIKKEYCNANGSFKSEADMRSIAMKYYNQLNSPDGGKTLASFEEDASKLPSAFFQGLWHGATLGFYKRDHHGDVMKTVYGREISKEDKVANAIGDVIGTSAAVGALGFGAGMATENGTELVKGTAKELQEAVDWKNLEEGEKLLKEKFNNKSFEAALSELEEQELAKATEITKAREALEENQQKAFDQAKDAKKTAENELAETKKLIEEKQAQLNSPKKDSPKSNQLKKEIKALNNKANSINTKLIDGTFDKAIATAETNLKNANEAIEALEKARKELAQQKEILNRVPSELKFASDATRDRLSASYDKLSKLNTDKNPNRVTNMIDDINNGKTTAKKVAKQIHAETGSKAIKGLTKCKGKLGLLGLIAGAAVGIYNVCTD